MAVALVQTRTVAAAASTITLAAWSPAPVVGNVGVIVAELYASGSNTPTITAPNGWTTVVSQTAVNSSASVQLGLAVFMRRFDGTSNDTVTGMTTTAASYRVVAHEFSGLSSDAVTAVVVGAVQRVTTTTTNPLVTAPVTPTRTQAYALTAVASRSASAPTAITWGGGAAAVFSQLASNSTATGARQMGDSFAAAASQVTLTASIQAQMAVTLAIPTTDSRQARLKRDTTRPTLKRYDGTNWVPVPVRRFNRRTGAWETLA